MPTTKEIAEDVLKRTDRLKEMIQICESGGVNKDKVSAAIIGSSPSVGFAVSRLGLMTGLGSVVLNIIAGLMNDTKGVYSVRNVSSLTGIVDWKLRRYISSGKLKAKSGNSCSNPGKAGYVIQKDDLIEFLKENQNDLKKTKESDDSAGEGAKRKKMTEEAVINDLKSLISEIDNAVSLVNMEIRLNQLTNGGNAEDREHLTYEILLGKLQYAKTYCVKTLNSLKKEVLHVKKQK